MASKETDEYTARPETFVEEAGTSLKAAVDIARRYGVALEAELPFTINTLMYKDAENTLFASASTRRIANYFNLNKSVPQWKAWLASSGPILAGLNVDATWDDAAKTRGLLDTFRSDSVRGGHAVCVVGYTTDRFIIRNSWGAQWGDSGFGYASLSYIADGFFPESYGVTL